MAHLDSLDQWVGQPAHQARSEEVKMPIPALVATAIGTVLTAAAQQQQQQMAGTQQAAMQAANSQGQNGMHMRPSFEERNIIDQRILESGQNDYQAGDLGETLKKLQGAMGASTPASKINEMQQKVDAGRFPLTPTEAGNLDKAPGGILNKDFFSDAAKDQKPKMSFDDKMQYAAMAASLGSALAGPSSAPGAHYSGPGGLQMAPVFQNVTARGLYNG
jgi:hypothetical protein